MKKETILIITFFTALLTTFPVTAINQKLMECQADRASPSLMASMCSLLDSYQSSHGSQGTIGIATNTKMTLFKDYSDEELIKNQLINLKFFLIEDIYRSVKRASIFDSTLELFNTIAIVYYKKKQDILDFFSVQKVDVPHMLARYWYIQTNPLSEHHPFSNGLQSFLDASNPSRTLTWSCICSSELTIHYTCPFHQENTVVKAFLGMVVASRSINTPTSNPPLNSSHTPSHTEVPDSKQFFHTESF